MTLIYKPIGIILGILSGLLGKRVFNFIWTKVEEQDPPTATTQDVKWPKLLTVAAFQGAIYMVVRVIVNRNAAQAWSYITGVWPGEKRPDPDE